MCYNIKDFNTDDSYKNLPDSHRVMSEDERTKAVKKIRRLFGSAFKRLSNY